MTRDMNYAQAVNALVHLKTTLVATAEALDVIGETQDANKLRTIHSSIETLRENVVMDWTREDAA